MKWSDLYLDYITHYPEHGAFALSSHRRASVTRLGISWQLSKWYRGCGFKPETITFTSIEDAKKAGEEWVNNAK